LRSFARAEENWSDFDLLGLTMSVSFGRIKAGAFALPLARLVALTPPQDTDLRSAAVILVPSRFVLELILARSPA
jgi:hypothetical protein